MTITDTTTNERRAMCRAVQPRPTHAPIGVTGAPTLAGVNDTAQEPDSPVQDPMAEIVRTLALRGNRHPHSVAYALVKLRIFTDLDEAQKCADRYYPHRI